VHKNSVDGFYPSTPNIIDPKLLISGSY